MNDKTSFVDACLAGDCDLDAIDDFIDAWHDGDSGMPLWQFLGVTLDSTVNLTHGWTHICRR